MIISQEIFDFSKELTLIVYELSYDEYNDIETRKIITNYLNRIHLKSSKEYVEYFIKCDEENNNNEVLEKGGIIVESYLLHKYDDIYDVVTIDISDEGLFAYFNNQLILKNM